MTEPHVDYTTPGWERPDTVRNPCPECGGDLSHGHHDPYTHSLLEKIEDNTHD